jgi:hypothetical protein
MNSLGDWTTALPGMIYFDILFIKPEVRVC